MVIGFPWKSRLQAASAAVFVAGLAALSGSADATVTVHPMLAEVSATAGGHAQVSFVVSNGDAHSYDGNGAVTDLALAPNGFPTAATEPQERGASRWLTVKPAAFSLGPRQAIVVKADLRPPRGLAGTYSAMVTFKFTSGSTGESPSRLQMNAVVLIRVRGSRPAKPEIAIDSIDLSAGSPAQALREWLVRVPVVNTGSTHTRVFGAVVIRQIGRGVVASMPITSGQGLILPKGHRDLVGMLDQPLTDGAYVAVATVWAEPEKIEKRRVGYFLVKGGVLEARAPNEAALRELASLLPAITCDPLIIQESLPAGGRRTAVLRATNHTSGPLLVRVALAPVVSGLANQAVLPSAIPPERYRPDIFVVSPEVAEIQPGRDAVFRVTGAIPRDASGQYFSYLVFAPSPIEAGQAPPAPTGALLAMMAKDTSVRSTQVDRIELRNSQGANPTCSARVTNTGNVLAAYTGSVVITASDGRELQRGSFALSTPVLPGCSATVLVKGDRALPPGKYVIRVVATTQEGPLAAAEATAVVD